MSTLQPLGRDFAAGAIFGGALYSAGVYHPSVIISQLRFSSFQMLEVMMGASAASALIFQLAHNTGHLPKQVRPPATLGFFSYDGNVIGGALVGAGMGLSGACPGTVIVQTATGIPSGPYVLLGGVLGAAAWLALKPMFPASNQKVKAGKIQKQEAPTIAKLLGTSEMKVLIGWEALCILAVGAFLKYFPAKTFGLVNPIIGGILIGLAQAATVGLAKHTIGASKTYEDIAQGLRQIFGQSSNQKASSSWQNLITPSIAFAAGVFLCASTLNNSKDFSMASSAANAAVSSVVSKPRAVLAGVSLVFGSRMAGGCTSGHCLSGLANFSVSSAVTAAAMFAAGAVVATLT